LLILALSGLWGCAEEEKDASDIFSSTAKRVEENLLPEVLDEGETVLRNLLNLLPVMSEICTVPLAEMGAFVSALPELQNAQQQVSDYFTIQNDGTWKATWRDVVFGDIGGQHTAGSGTPSVDVTLTMSFRSQGQTLLEVMPFALTPASALTIRDSATPPACTAEAPEGFFLFQDAATGLWTLSWCAQDTPKRFAGSISATAVTRVLRNVSDNAESLVSSLSVNTAASQLTFDEATAPMEDKGIRFYVRPGDAVTFELRLQSGDDLSAITREQLRLGNDELLPPDLDPGAFRLASSVPIVPTGEPLFTPGLDLGVFIWQDIDNNTCLPQEDEQWRVRFSTPTRTTFSGSIQAVALRGEDRIRAVPVGGCPGGGTDDEDARFAYECTVQGAAPSGYDVCVVNAGQMFFFSEMNRVREPGLISIGAAQAAPPSPDPFNIRFDVALEERRPGRGLKLTQGDIALRGNDNVDEEGDDDEVQAPLNPQQVSLDPLCRPPAAPGLPSVRLTGEGAYDTDRFEGSRYELDDVSFTQPGAISLDGRQRYPTLGEIELRTRQNLDRVEMDVFMPRISAIDTRIVSVVDVEMRLDTVLFNFYDRMINLTVE
jgi:hypothetical protein